MLALDVSHLTVALDGTRILDDLSFRVEAGTTLAVIGPNGSGKTILFRALIGALPVEGTLTWAADTRIGYVPQKLDIERDLPLTGLDFLEAKAAVSHAGVGEIPRLLGLVNLPREDAARPSTTGSRAASTSSPARSARRSVARAGASPAVPGRWSTCSASARGRISSQTRWRR